MCVYCNVCNIIGEQWQTISYSYYTYTCAYIYMHEYNETRHRIVVEIKNNVET